MDILIDTSCPAAIKSSGTITRNTLSWNDYFTSAAHSYHIVENKMATVNKVIQGLRVFWLEHFSLYLSLSSTQPSHYHSNHPFTM